MLCTTIHRRLAACLLAAALASAGLSTRATAQTAVTVNPIDLVNGYTNFEVEAPLLPFLSFHAGLNFLVWEGAWADARGEAFAVGPEMGVRFFPFMSSPTGFWVGPFVGLAYFRASDGDEEVRRAGLYGGAMAGLTAILGDVFVLSGGIGLGYHDLNEIFGGEQVGPNELSPRFRLALGFAF